MQFINAQYKVIKLENENRYGSIFVVEDIFNANIVKRMRVVNFQNDTKEFISFMKDAFYDLGSILHPNNGKFYSFNKICYVDGKPFVGNKYYYTYEHFESMNLFKHCASLDFGSKLDLAVQICSIIYYMHLKNYNLCNINPGEIRLIKNEGHLLVKMLSLFYPEGSDQSIMIDKNNNYFKAPEVISTRKYSEASDIYLIGVILYHIFVDENFHRTDFKSSFTNFYPSAESELFKIKAIIRKCTEFNPILRYESVNSIIQDINKVFNKNYVAIDKEYVNVIPYRTKPVARKRNTEVILKNIDKFMNEDQRKIATLVVGDAGTGKSHFLVYMARRIAMEGLVTYYRLAEKGSSPYSLIVSMLQNVYHYAAMEIKDKYMDDISKVAPEITGSTGQDLLGSLEKAEDKTRLMYRLANFLIESAEMMGFVFIIKNLDYVDKESLSVIEYLINSNDKRKIYFIFTLNDEGMMEDNNKDHYIYKLINSLKENSSIDSIKLTNFNLNETIEYISILLGTKEKPIEFATSIFKETEGNPYLIYELVHMVHNKGFIRINEKYKWEFDHIDFKKYKDSLSIDDIALNKISSLADFEVQILEASSIFNTAVSIDIIEEMLEKKISSSLYSILTSLSDRNILSRRVDDWGATFDFYSASIKKAVYDNMEVHKRIKYHEKAANILEDKFLKENRDNKDELIYHLIRANRRDEAIDYLISSAERILDANLIPQAVQFLEQALALFEEKVISGKKAVVCKKLGDLSKQLCNYDKAIEYYSMGEAIGELNKDDKILVDIYINKFDTFYKINDIKACLKYASKVKRLLKTVHYPEGGYEFVINLYDLMIYRRKYKTYENILNKCLENCIEEKHMYYHAMLLINYGRIIQISGRHSEGLESILKGSRILEEIEAFAKLPIALNAIGKIYLEYYHDLEKAREYFEKCLSISERMNLVRLVESSYNNLAEIYREEDRHAETIEYYNKGLEVTKASGNKYVQTIIQLNCGFVYLEMGDYIKATEYTDCASKYLSKSKDVGDLTEYYYEFQAAFNYHMGNLDKAIEYAQKSIDMCTNWGITTNMSSVYVKTISEFCLEKATYKEVYDFCIQLYDQYLYKLGRAACANFAEICICRGNTMEGQELYDLGISYRDKIDTTLLQSKYKYVDALLSTGENRLNKLNDLLSKYSNIEDKKVKCRTFYTIANYYFVQENYVDALRYYIFALDYLKKLTYNVTDEKKEEYISSHGRSEIKEELLRTISLITGNSQCNEELEFKNADSYFDIVKYKDVLTSIEVSSKTDLQLLDKEASSSYLYKIIDTVNKFTDNSQKNLSQILELCLELTNAKNAFVAILDEENGFRILSTHNSSTVLNAFHRYIIEQVRQRKQSTLITDIYEYGINKEIPMQISDISSVLCLPIINDNKNDIGRRKEQDKNDPIGYLYLDTDSIINNFTKQSLAICTIAAKLAYIMIDNYYLKTISTIDKVTKLYTRKYFENMLQNEIYKGKKENRRLSILMIDIDKFKLVNDRYGHQKGDEVLQNVASIVMDNVRETDVCARYGGEEFILLLPDTDSQGAKSLAEKLRIKIENAKLLGFNNSLTVSIGISSFPENSIWEKDLIEKADKALYFAKENNRNRSVLYKPNMSKIIKKIDKLSGIISGNMVEDQRNVETMLEILDLVRNREIPFEAKLIQFLARIIEISEADIGGILTVKDGNAEKVICRKSQSEMTLDSMNYNKELIDNCIKRKGGEFLIDWTNYFDIDPITNIPDWQSVITVPIVVGDSVKAVLYLSVSIKRKEFDASIYNYIRTLFDILSVIY